MKKIKNLSNISGGNSVLWTVIKSVTVTAIIFESLLICSPRSIVARSRGFEAGQISGFNDGYSIAISHASDKIDAAKTMASNEFNSGFHNGYDIGYFEGISDSI